MHAIYYLLYKVDELMKNLVLHFQILDLKGKFFYKFLTQSNLQIFVIFTYFVNIWTLNAYKKKLWLGMDF